ncbi:hypothetical protein C8Q76DRAFT_694369 [Earliella scabrosa]|nr:hypothetical protein C8Q76DRAFT_694369 [Earliella scabrosa]
MKFTLPVFAVVLFTALVGAMPAQAPAKRACAFEDLDSPLNKDGTDGAATELDFATEPRNPIAHTANMMNRQQTGNPATSTCVVRRYPTDLKNAHAHDKFLEWRIIAANELEALLLY